MTDPADLPTTTDVVHSLATQVGAIDQPLVKAVARYEAYPTPIRFRRVERLQVRRSLLNRAIHDADGELPHLDQD